MGEEESTATDAADHGPVGTILRGLDSEELAWRAKQGCQASFTELVHRYAPRLQVFLHRKTRRSHEVEDLVQDTFIKAYENLGRYDDSWKFSTWLFTIASRLAVSHRRKREPRLSVLDLPSQIHEDEPLEMREADSLWTQVAELPDGQQQALWLKYAEDLSVKEIAKAMGKSQVCVKVLLYRARVGLAKRLKENPEAAGIDL